MTSRPLRTDERTLQSQSSDRSHLKIAKPFAQSVLLLIFTVLSVGAIGLFTFLFLMERAIIRGALDNYAYFFHCNFQTRLAPLKSLLFGICKQIRI